jgi:LEA14-like dessication related protein
MKGFTKILLIASAGLATWYVPTLIAIYNLDMSILSVLPSGMTDTVISFFATIQLNNKSSFNVFINNINAEIYFDGKKIAQINNIEPMVLLNNSVQNFNVTFSIDAQLVGIELINQLKAQNLQNSVITIKGTLNANSKIIPFNMYRTLANL